MRSSHEFPIQQGVLVGLNVRMDERTEEFLTSNEQGYVGVISTFYVETFFFR